MKPKPLDTEAATTTGATASAARVLPCATCPWRVNQTAAAIPNYKRNLACNLLNTVGPDDGLRQIMACHRSPVDDMRACNGYLAREGWRNINVRILLSQGRIISPDQALEACEAAGIDLHPDYESVLEKLEATELAALSQSSPVEVLGTNGPKSSEGK